jgi:hypothetical protein
VGARGCWKRNKDEADKRIEQANRSYPKGAEEVLGEIEEHVGDRDG